MRTKKNRFVWHLSEYGIDIFLVVLALIAGFAITAIYFGLVDYFFGG